MDTLASLSTPVPAHRTTVAVWMGRVLTTLAALFLAMDVGFKFNVTPEAVESMNQLGWPIHTVFWIGIVQAVLLALYLIPRTAIFGAVLWTGYLGGAVAVHLRVGNPLFSHLLFPLYVAAFIWGGLWLRNEKSRAVLPFFGGK